MLSFKLSRTVLVLYLKIDPIFRTSFIIYELATVTSSRDDSRASDHSRRQCLVNPMLHDDIAADDTMISDPLTFQRYSKSFSTGEFGD